MLLTFYKMWKTIYFLSYINHNFEKKTDADDKFKIYRD